MLYDALHGRLTDHHRFMLGLYLGHYDALVKAIAKINQAAAFLSLISLLCSVPGIAGMGAMIILAEIGRDMSRFPAAGHLLAWAGRCPGNQPPPLVSRTFQ